MKGRPKITKVEVRQFNWQMKNAVPNPNSGFAIYQQGSILTRSANIVRVFTDVGITGEYMGGSSAEFSAFPMIIPRILGRNALERDAIYTDVKHMLQQSTPTAVSPLDIALWDLAGKFYDSPVYELLGGPYRTSIPTYASCWQADRSKDGLNSPEAHADFAQQCLELGYKGYKTHPWEMNDSTVEEWIATNHAIAKQVGGKMDLMLDGHCALRTFGEALKVGWSCDEENFFWWEDPYMHAESAFPYRKLHKMVKTPLLQMEHVWGLEAHIDNIVAEGTDFVRGDVLYDGGITGVMKIAHACEGFGLDIEMHRAGPAERQVIAAIRNTNYYEMCLVHPKGVWLNPDVYKSDYKDGLEAIDKNGCVPVPEGPGLGVEYDWDHINKHTTSVVVYE
jgi:L-alanine-DL-glutamate epimerase-like enolase superfamily enzyme